MSQSVYDPTTPPRQALWNRELRSRAEQLRGLLAEPVKWPDTETVAKRLAELPSLFASMQADLDEWREQPSGLMVLLAQPRHPNKLLDDRLVEQFDGQSPRILNELITSATIQERELINPVLLLQIKNPAQVAEHQALMEDYPTAGNEYDAPTEHTGYWYTIPMTSVRITLVEAVATPPQS
jgi:hypothetical protein